MFTYFVSVLDLWEFNRLAQPLAHVEDLSICEFNVFVCLKLFFSTRVKHSFTSQFSGVVRVHVYVWERKISRWKKPCSVEGTLHRNIWHIWLYAYMPPPWTTYQMFSRVWKRSWAIVLYVLWWVKIPWKSIVYGNTIFWPWLMLSAYAVLSSLLQALYHGCLTNIVLCAIKLMAEVRYQNHRPVSCCSYM